MMVILDISLNAKMDYLRSLLNKCGESITVRGVQWAGPHFEPLSGPFLERLCKVWAKNGLLYNSNETGYKSVQ